MTWIGLAAFQSTATWEMFGTTSLSSSSRFPSISDEIEVNPVMFPPGRARLATRPVADRIADSHHDKGDRRCRLLDGERGRRAGGHDHIHIEGDQLGDENGKALILSFRPSILDRDVAALHVAELAQAFAERPDEIGLERRGGVPQKTDPGDFPALLRARRKRPRAAAPPSSVMNSRRFS